MRKSVSLAGVLAIVVLCSVSMVTPAHAQSADLSISITDAPDPVAVAGVITYSIRVDSLGLNDAQNVTWSMSVPANTTFLSLAPWAGWSCSTPAVGATGTVSCTIDTLVVEDLAVFPVQVTVDGGVSVGTVISATANVTSTVSDPNTDQNTASTTTTVGYAMTLGKADAPDPVAPGANLTYTVTLVNIDETQTGAMSWTDPLPAGTTFVSIANPAAWTCTTPAVGGTGTVTCSIPDGSFGTHIFTLVVNVNAATPLGTVLTNTATLTVPTTLVATATTTVATTTARLSVTKSCGQSPVQPGATLSSTITLTNEGPDAAANVELADPIPIGTTFLSLSSPGGWTCTTPAVGGIGPVLCSIASMGVGTATFTLDVVVGATVPAGTTLTNAVAAASVSYDDDLVNNADTCQATVGAPPGTTSVDLTDAPDPVNVGSVLAYTVVIQNAVAGATGAALTFPLPTDTTFSSLSAPGGWSCTTPALGSPGAVVCTSATLPEATLTFALNVTVGASYVANSTISATATLTYESDGAPREFSASEDTAVLSPSLVTATKTYSGTRYPGSTLTYAVTVSNAGPGSQSDNPDAELTDVLPASLALVSATATLGTATATLATNTVTWNGSIPAGGSVTIAITATILASTLPGTTVSNQAALAYDADGNGTNEAAGLSDDPAVGGATDPTVFTAISPATLSATKTVAGLFRPGETITYAVVVSNAGPAAQYDNPGNELNDVLPASLALVSATATLGTATATLATNTVTWNGSIPAGGSVTITITATILTSTLPGTAVSNQATLAFDADGNGTNEAAALSDDPAVAGAADPTVFTVLSPAVLSATKVAAGLFRPSATITYTLAVSNAGPAAQYDNPGNELTDVLPASLALVSATATLGTATATLATNTVTWNGSIPASGSVTITITATILASTLPGTAVSNQATLAYDADGNGTNEAAGLSDDPAVAGAADPTVFTVLSPAVLSATKTAAGLFRPGGTITYTVVVGNAGPAAQYDNPGNELTDVLPASLALVSATATLGTATATLATNTVTWNGSIPASGSVTITITATILASTLPGTAVSNQATFVYDADGNGTNEASGLSDDPAVAGATNPTVFTMLSPATLSATKIVTGAYYRGGVVNYTVVIGNSGPSAQYDNPGNELTDALPPTLVLTGASATAGTAGANLATNTVGWNGAIPAGSSVTLTITATVSNAAFPGAVISNQATLAHDADGNGTNEASGVSDDPSVGGAADPTDFTVVSPAGLAATKAVGGDQFAGGFVRYTILVTNTGPAAQLDNPGPELIDVLPAALSLQWASATSGNVATDFAANSVAWNGTLAPGASVTITVVAMIAHFLPVGQVISNQAEIHYDLDGNGTNESTTLSDDPIVGGLQDPTDFAIQPANPIPLTDAFGLALLICILASLGALFLFRRQT
jgi:uncharacterized repeat protein (TIGR01451 family)